METYRFSDKEKVPGTVFNKGHAESSEIWKDPLLFIALKKMQQKTMLPFAKSSAQLNSYFPL